MNEAATQGKQSGGGWSTKEAAETPSFATAAK
jgi:hypothetical protein